MSTRSEHLQAWSGTPASEPSGFCRDRLGRALASLTEARRRSVNNRVALYLEGFGDLRLVILGFSAAEIEAIRGGRCVADVLAQRSRGPSRKPGMPDEP